MDRTDAGAVAIVDDDAAVRDVLSVFLEMAGHTVKSYASGADYLADTDRSEVLCLVVDQKMPGMTGLELLIELDRRGESVPTLLLTGMQDADLVRQSSRLGVITVLEKPVAPERLLQFIAYTAG
jgi:two-component system, LuxR family, response regulator FixJ